MSLNECIVNANKEGIISDVKKSELQENFKEFEKDFIAQGLSKADAEREAGRSTFDALKHAAAEKKRQSLLTLQAQTNILKFAQKFRNVAGEIDPAEAFLAVLHSNNRMPYTDLETRYNTVRGQLYSEMTNYILKFKRTFTGGVRNQYLMDDVVREMFNPGSTKNPIARELAEASSHVLEKTRLRFNKAGGQIPKLKNYGMPQHHDELAISKFGQNEWIKFVKPLLNKNKMIDEKTGLPFNEGSLEIALAQVWNTITTEGMNKVRPGGAAGFGKSIAGRRTDHRFLIFNDADGWLAYQKQFGKSDPYSTVIGHIDSMARDIASMEVLGANPNATINWMKTYLKKQALLDDQKNLRKKYQVPGRTNKDRNNSKINLIENIWRLHQGTLNNPVDASISRTLAGVRQILTAAQLGTASILAIGDFNFTRIAARMNGIPATRAVFSNLRQFAKGLTSDELADLAMSAGIIGESFLTVSSAQARYVGEVFSPEFAKRINETVLRASGLSHITQAGKFGFGMEMFRHIAREKNKAFSELNPKFREFFERNGLLEEHWNIIRNTPMYEHKGVQFIRPDDIYANNQVNETLARDISNKLLDGVNREINFAVPSSSYRAKATLMGNTRPGTLQGELMFSATMYKNFTLTIAFTHIARALFAQKTMTGKLGAIGGLLFSATIIGALTYELKNLTKGKDVTPYENMDMKYWLNAMVHGGGLGIFGDFFYSSTNRFGGGFGKTVVGAVGGFLYDTANIAVINPMKMGANLFLDDQDDYKVNMGGDVSNFIKRYTPGASLWYTRLAFERLFEKMLQEMIDPDFDKKIQKKEKRERKTTGREYWWGGGQALPDRKPKINPFR